MEFSDVHKEVQASEAQKVVDADNLRENDVAADDTAPTSRGDEGTLEGVTIETFTEGESSDSDDEENGIVIHAGRTSSIRRSTPFRSPASKAFQQRALMSPMDAQSSSKSKTLSNTQQDELKKLRFPRPQTAFDVDIESLDEQPWRNRNVDLLDYFNYGFNEQTWMQYCEKQLRLRAEKGQGPQQSVVAKPAPPVISGPVKVISFAVGPTGTVTTDISTTMPHTASSKQSTVAPETTGTTGTSSAPTVVTGVSAAPAAPTQQPTQPRVPPAMTAPQPPMAWGAPPPQPQHFAQQQQQQQMFYQQNQQPHGFGQRFPPFQPPPHAQRGDNLGSFVPTATASTDSTQNTGEVTRNAQERGRVGDNSRIDREDRALVSDDRRRDRESGLFESRRDRRRDESEDRRGGRRGDDRVGRRSGENERRVRSDRERSRDRTRDSSRERSDRRISADDRRRSRSGSRDRKRGRAERDGRR